MRQISAKSYMTLCALVSDARQVKNDAAPLLDQVASELALDSNQLPADIRNNPKKLAALQEAGFIRKASGAAANKQPYAVHATTFDAY